MSLAAAMTLDFAPGSFYRNACLSCINLLLTYRSGCAAKCAYCGLSGAKEKKESTSKSFIRVTWPAFTLDEIVAGIVRRQERVKRICISMLTNSRAPRDAAEICRRLRQAIDIPVSMLVSPTILTRRNLEELRDAGADKIGVAIDRAV